jgi:hypothetical protein
VSFVCRLGVQFPAHCPAITEMLPIVILSPLDPAAAASALAFGGGLAVAAAWVAASLEGSCCLKSAVARFHAVRLHWISRSRTRNGRKRDALYAYVFSYRDRKVRRSAATTSMAQPLRGMLRPAPAGFGGPSLCNPSSAHPKRRSPVPAGLLEYAGSMDLPAR